MSENKTRFKQFCEDEANVPLFLSWKWYNSLFLDNEWDVQLITKKDKIIAVWPYFISNKLGFKRITIPPLTPYCGPFIVYPPDQKETSRLSYEKEVITELCKSLPKTDSFIQTWYPGKEYFLPLLWSGFTITPRITYIIADTSKEEKVFSDFKENIRRTIRKAEKTLSIEVSTDIDLLYRMKSHSARLSKGEAIDFDQKYLSFIYDGLSKTQQCKILVARNEDKHAVAIVLLVWDKTTCYYLVGSSDPLYKNSGGNTLLLWEAIKLCGEKGLSFNFEGSMIENVERYFRAFGGHPTIYYLMSKEDSAILKGVKKLRK